MLVIADKKNPQVPARLAYVAPPTPYLHSGGLLLVEGRKQKGRGDKVRGGREETQGKGRKRMRGFAGSFDPPNVGVPVLEYRTWPD